MTKELLVAKARKLLDFLEKQNVSAEDGTVILALAQFSLLLKLPLPRREIHIQAQLHGLVKTGLLPVEVLCAPQGEVEKPN